MLEVYAGLRVCHKVMYVYVIYTIFLIEHMECAKKSIFYHIGVCQRVNILSHRSVPGDWYSHWGGGGYAIKLIVLSDFAFYQLSSLT